jgi:CheY-like chemotaxis protein
MKNWIPFNTAQQFNILDQFSADPSEHIGQQILVVDDMPDNCFILQAFLEAEGFEVDIAESGCEAIAKIESNLPMLVLLDVMMPDMTGYEVAENIRENLHLADLPILFVTGIDLGSIPSHEQKKVNGVIRKPIDFEQLLEQVQSFFQASFGK